MRVFPPLFFSFCAGSLLIVPALAAPARLEGTLSLVQNGTTQRATLKWEAPDHLRIEVPRDEVSGAPAQIVVASGGDTQILDPNTRRVRHLGYNVAQKWWRGGGLLSGGPANFAFVGAKPGTVTEEDGQFWRRDKTLFGGGGTGGYYAAWKVKDRRWPREVVTTETTRVEKDDAGRETLSATVQLEGEVPKGASVTSGGANATYTYDLKPREAAFDAATWTLPEAATAVVEDDVLLASAAYTGTDGGSLYNRASALLRGSEDILGATAALQQAKAASPGASAPALLLFELALAGRNWAQAEDALRDLNAKGVASEEVEARRARLALAKRDYPAALQALDAALTAAPNFYELKLRRAQVLRIQGDMEAARGVWTSVLGDATAPDSFRVAAADAFAQFAAPDEWNTLRESIKGDSEPEKLAKALFSLRLGETPAATSLSSNAARSLWAFANERAGQDDVSLAAWNELEKNGDTALQNQARAHKVILAARRGDASASLDALRVWNESLVTEAERDAARIALFDAWQKAFKYETLATALDNRATATTPSNADLQLAYNFQNLYGDTESITKVLDVAVAAYSNDPFWKSKRAEQLTLRGIGLTVTTEASRTLRARVFQQAFAALDSAVEQSPDQPFYAMQRALVAAQRAAKLGITDAEIATRERKAGREAIDALLAAYPTDPDAQLSAAISLLALGYKDDLPRVVQLITTAIASPAGDGDRHTFISAARQTLAATYEMMGRRQDAAGQWSILLAGAQSAGEQAQLVSLSLALIERAKLPGEAAQLLSVVATDGWPSDAAREEQDALARRVLNSPLIADIVAALREANTPGAILAWANISQARLDLARAKLAVPGAPASADADLERATRDLNASTGLLRTIAQSNDPIMASRAAAFLAQRAGLSPEEGITFLRRAVALEPTDAPLRLALADALSGTNPTNEDAKTQRRLASQTLNFNPESQRLLALLYWVANDDKSAAALSKEAFNVSAHSPDSPANDFQRQAFVRAHILWTAGGQSEAIELYKGLASAQWLPVDRAAGLLGWRARYLESNQTAEAERVAAQIQTLGIDNKDLEKAARFLEQVEN